MALCLPAARVRAELISNTSNECVDVILLFARGSGQNNDHSELTRPLGNEFSRIEKESHAFFKNHADHFNNFYPNTSYKAISAHDFPDKYDPVGYKAAAVGWQSVARAGNSANADASWFPGDYQDSVQHGVAETVGYIKDQIASCPNQYFLVGGYSQGAQVMGESMFQLTDDERAKVLGVGLFGDPKYIGSSDGLPVKPSPTISFPWRRGEATNKDTGMLDPRVPYIPTSMERRTLSWCSRNDIVCAGWSALRKTSSHSAYSENPIRYTVAELVNIAAPQLLALDRGPDGSNIPPVQLSPADRDRERDVMILFNDNSNVDVINTLKGLDPMLPQFTQNFTGTRYAAKSFGEHDFGSFQAPRVDNIQSFLPLFGYDPSRPAFTNSNLSAAVLKKYGMLPFVVGGGDIQDPHQLALERAITSTGWREDPNVERNIILITDRPPKDPYEYNICNSTVRQWMHYPQTDGYKNCYTHFQREVWQKALVPETCREITMVILEDTCTNPLTAPHYIQTNKRTLDDEIKLAQAYNVKISVVIPHKFDPVTHLGNTLSDSKVRDKFRNLAHATGGAFIYYDKQLQYNSTLMYDTLWQVFTKKPQSINAVADGEPDKQVLGLKTNTPVVLDVSRNGVVAAMYNWDFDDNGTWDETTEGPVTEHEFPDTTQGLFRVQAQDSGGNVLAETRQAYIVTPGEEPLLEQPTLPEGIKAAQQADGTVLVTWAAEDTNELIIIDPVTNLPIGSAPLAAGSLIIPSSYETLNVRVVSETAVSGQATLYVEAYIVPIPTIVGGGNPPNPDMDDTICFKLQQCNQESTAPDLYPTPSIQITANNNILSTPTRLDNPITFAGSINASTPEVEGLSFRQPAPPDIQTTAVMPETSIVKRVPQWWLMLIVTAVTILAISAARRAVGHK